MDTLQGLVEKSKRIVFFGGAGVSTESGIPDFRSVDGLYHQRYAYPPETMLSHEFFLQNTEEFYRFYREKMVYLDAKPNAAHKKLAELEAAGKLTAVVTQNIDGLHQAAGSKTVYELHGSVHRNYCQKCGAFYDVRYLLETTGVPRCTKEGCGGVVKPDVVLYGESLGDRMDGAIEAIQTADLLIIGGTSLVVYPAAGLVQYCKGKVVVINQSPTPMDGQADLLLTCAIGTVLGALHKASAEE